MAADESTQRCWAIFEKLGRPVPDHIKAWEAVCDELTEHVTSSFQYMQIAGYVRKWMESTNPHYMDAAVMLCGVWNLPITETMQEQLTRVSRLRLSGDLSGTPDKIIKENALGKALMLMANLIYEGVTQKKAASKAAAAFKTHKASSLERYYSEQIKPEEEALLFENWRRTTPDHAEIWQPIIAAMPDTPEHERGERR